MTARRRGARAPAVVAGLVILLLAGFSLALAPRAAAAPRAVPLEPGSLAVVQADGECLNVRESPGLGGERVACLAHGSLVEVLDGAILLDGFRWQYLREGTLVGWAADEFLEPLSAGAPSTPGASQPPTEPTPPPGSTVPTSPTALPAPPAGGLTIGVAGTSDPAALVAAQPFPVETVSVLDVATQSFLVYIPGAPAQVNTLNGANLRAGSIVTIRRPGAAPAAGSAPVAESLPASGVANTLPSPVPGGLTQGTAGSNDPSAVAAAQPFPVVTVSMLHVASQRWLVFIPGAPAVVNTLHTGLLTPDSVVTLRRAGTASTSPPPTSPTPNPTSPTLPAGTVPGPAGNEPLDETAGAALREIRVTYYYCQRGTIAASIGDGGGFCGTMANGETVHLGAAACARHLMGERFRVQGDPDNRVYTCKDTGGGVNEGHRDIWFPDSDSGYLWFQAVGPTVTIERLPEVDGGGT